MSNDGSTFARVSEGQGKVMIGSIDQPNLRVYAQYNPKELQVDKTVPWAKVNEANQSNGQSTQDQGIHLEFTGAEGRTMSLELLFDGFEENKSVGPQVEVLEKLASVIEPGARTEERRRPHRCCVVWGQVLPSFNCVIESLSTKYTMFSKEGVPLRATCTVKLKEADVVSAKKKGAAPAAGGGPNGSGNGGSGAGGGGVRV